VTRNELDAAIGELLLAGRVVCVHSSLRSFGTVEGGADAVVDAFLDSGCTLLVPSHSWGFATNHLPGLRPHRGGEHGRGQHLPGDRMRLRRTVMPAPTRASRS